MSSNTKSQIPPLGPLAFPTRKPRNLPDVEVSLPTDELMAVAIAYGEDPSSTTIKSKAHGAMAQLIIDKANEEGIFVHQDKELVAALIQMQANKQIPNTLIACITEILIWLDGVTNEQDGADARDDGRN